MTRKMLGALVALALMSTVPVSAHADTSVPGTDNQDFAVSQGGWTQSTGSSGLCVPVLLCPEVTNEFVAAGGAAGGADGYIRTQFHNSLSVLTGSSIGTWESPAFTYQGNGGVTPASAILDLSIRPQVSALLGVGVENSPRYRVDLVDQTNGTAVSAVPTTDLVSDIGWTAIPSAQISPSLLSIGRAYKIRITTSYQSIVALVATGEVGYDNVRLTTSGTASGTNGTDGKNGGSGITTARQLRHLVKTYILPGSAKLVGNKLKVKLRCPAIAAPKPCKITLQGLAKGKFSKPATARKVVTIKAGKVRKVLIRVKPKYLATYKTAKKVFVKTTVRVGHVRVTVRKRVKLLH